MENLDNILQDRLTIIHEEFTHNLGDKIVEIKDIWSNAQYGRCDSTEIKRLKKLSQEIAISSASFNLFLIADKAYKLEQFLTSLSDDKKYVSETYRRQIELLIQSLETVSINMDSTDQQSKPHRWEPAAILPELDRNTSQIYILETNHIWAEPLINKLQQQSYQVQIFNNYEAFKRAFSNNIPKLIITDIKLSINETAEDLKLNYRYNNIDDLPIIFVAQEDDMETRLLAVRSGTSYFITLPVDTNKLIDKVEALTTGVPKDPYRVMIINDDIPMAEFYAKILEQEGMNVTIVNNPLMTLDMIENNRPELILLNVSMPAFSGLELTKIIRQEEKFTGIAIVFLSTESDNDKQLTAINTGGDDFISMPVDADYLIATICSRVSRARTLNTMNYNLLTALRELENQQFALNQHAIVSITNINGSIIYVNDKLCDISGYTRPNLIGKDHNILNSAVHDDDFFKEMWSTISKGEVWQGEICNKKKNGDFYWVNTTIVPFIDKQMRPYQYVSINSDITSKKFTEQDLLKARDIAINASQAKSDFLSKMSHELRTPLNAVLGFSQLLESSKEHSLSDIQLQYINEIHNAGNHLLHLINDVLDLSRIEANQLIAESINIPLSAFLDECCALILPVSKQKNLEILTHYKDSEELYVYADPLRLKQIMANLLSNAVKYNKPNGTIGINAYLKNDGRIIIEVTDTGEGISDDQIDKLFQPFTRLPQHKKEEGVGIGLALSKRLAELMGGKIGVHSTVGEGATFWVEITEAIPDINNKPKQLDNVNSAYIIPKTDVPTTLLYIEDNETNYLLVKELLAVRPNIKLFHTYTVMSGIELANEQHPDIILMDLQLPDMSGFDGIHLLKKDETLKSIPVIAISAYADAENIQHALAQGFVEYITKPIDVNNFLVTIDKYHPSN